MPSPQNRHWNLAVSLGKYWVNRPITICSFYSKNSVFIWHKYFICSDWGAVEIWFWPLNSHENIVYNCDGLVRLVRDFSSHNLNSIRELTPSHTVMGSYPEQVSDTCTYILGLNILDSSLELALLTNKVSESIINWVLNFPLQIVRINWRTSSLFT
jgi:hypothetical protein